MHEESPSKNAKNTWSASVRELSGRLQIEFEDLNPGLRHAVFLELRNNAREQVALCNQPNIQAELFDASAMPVRASGVLVSGPQLVRQWAVVPGDAYIGFRGDIQIAGLPTKEQEIVLLAIGSGVWELPVGIYKLGITLLFEKDNEGPENQWVGELKLPPVEFEVTRQMFT